MNRRSLLALLPLSLFAKPKPKPVGELVVKISFTDGFHRGLAEHQAAMQKLIDAQQRPYKFPENPYLSADYRARLMKWQPKSPDVFPNLNSR